MIDSKVTRLMISISAPNQVCSRFGLKRMRMARLTGGTPLPRYRCTNSPTSSSTICWRSPATAGEGLVMRVRRREHVSWIAGDLPASAFTLGGCAEVPAQRYIRARVHAEDRQAPRSMADARIAEDRRPKRCARTAPNGPHRCARTITQNRASLGQRFRTWLGAPRSDQGCRGSRHQRRLHRRQQYVGSDRGDLCGRWSSRGSITGWRAIVRRCRQSKQECSPSKCRAPRSSHAGHRARSRYPAFSKFCWPLSTSWKPASPKPGWHWIAPISSFSRRWGASPRAGEAG